MKGEDRLEILSVDLLKDEVELVDSFRERARGLGIQLGWHYDLDLAWLGSQLDDPSTLRILDAGAGTGVLQWWLADRGAHVVTVDRLYRADLSGRFRLAYRVDGLRPEDLLPTRTLISYRISQADQSVGLRLKGALRATATTVLAPFRSKSPGRVTLYRQDLDNLADLKDESFDMVVSVSALEHNNLEDLPKVVAELLRVLKQDGLLLVTVPAARDEDWYHEPSRGWCFTEKTLRHVFALSPDCKSNFSEYDSLFLKIRESETLRRRLAPIFYRSGDNGMPWGNWDPQYQPVGVRKRKA